jgi:hypothetical protein
MAGIDTARHGLVVGLRAFSLRLHLNVWSLNKPFMYHAFSRSLPLCILTVPARDVLPSY